MTSQISEHHMVLHESLDARNPEGTWTRITRVFCRTEDKAVWEVTDTFQDGEHPPSRVREAMAVPHDPRCEVVHPSRYGMIGCQRMAGHTGKHQHLAEWGSE
jgi:hypothetical protein